MRMKPEVLFIALFTSTALAQQPPAPATPAPSKTTIVIEAKDLKAALEDGKAVEAGAAAAAAKPADPNAAANPAAKPEVKKTDPDTALLSKISKIKFDRRPSVILKDWANPNPEEDPPADDAADTKEPKLDPSGKPIPPKDEHDIALEGLRQEVMRGNWPAVGTFFGEGFEDEKKAALAFKTMLSQLARTPQPPRTSPSNPVPVQPGSRPTPRPSSVFLEKNLLLPTDIIGIADAHPGALDAKTVIPQLGGMLRGALARGYFPDEVLELLRTGSAKLGGKDAAKKADAARLLMAAGLPVEAGEFLPEPKDTEDPELLDLLTTYHLALQAKEPKKDHLAGAWNITQRILAMPKIKREQREAALQRAVEMAPQVEEELGMGWLGESFTGDAQRGREVLATIGALTSSKRSEYSADSRLRRLKLQKTAAEALLGNEDVDLKPWQAALNMMAMNWLEESNHTQRYDTTQTRRPQMRWDSFGNMYYDQSYQRTQMQPNQGNIPRPISTGEILEARPDDKWLTQVSADLRPKFAAQFAKLFLKVNEPEDAFPHIEGMAKTHPDSARELAEEFLRIWSENRNPNNSRNNTYRYGYQYGYNQRANSIPLTRSKQQRNLTELAKWVKKLKALPIEGLDNNALAGAFSKVHSSAEVYRLDAITGVFGDFKEMEPETIAAFAQTMRRNLATIWRDPKVQDAAKTKRKDKDIIAEIARGYQSAYSIVLDAIEAHPEDWQLQLARACIALDELNFATEYAGGTGGQFVARRDQSYAMFAKAAECYSAKLPDSEDEESSEAYEHWFYAALGAADLGALKETLQPSPAQIPKVKAALDALPKGAAKRHMARFANSLAARISSVKPELKQRYLKHGLEIVGDHEKAAEARKVFEYYADLITEIQLVANIDGSDTVGHSEPFGMFVDIRHTKEIERESGGFSKYLVNQNNSSYGYNYGRPTQNYREKFEETARGALAEHFEVMSVTFHDSKNKSRGTEQPGWRVTPYAYILMKAKNADVDKVPPLQIDLDFLETSGFVILPVATASLPIDARPEQGKVGELAKLKVTQILDEREAKDGKLGLEIKASAHGLVPPLEQLLDIDPKDFELVSTEGGELTIAQMDAEGDVPAAISERNWTMKFEAKEKAEQFAFPKPKLETEELAYQRYDDADLTDAEQVVSLTEEYGKDNNNTLWAAIIIGALLLIGLIAAIFWPRNKPTTPKAQSRFEVPEEVTPFTVINLLRRIRDENNLPADTHSQLAESIDNIERHYFDRTGGDEPDLEAVAKEWVKKAA